MAVLGTDKFASSVWGRVMGYLYGVPGKVGWIVQVDWDNDGTWGAEIESQDIRSVKFKRGREGRMRGDGNGQNHPDGESFDIEIRDTAGKYDVFNSGSEIYDRMGRPGLLLRILIVDTTTKAQAEPVFVGTLTGIDWDADAGWGRLSGTGLSRYLELGAASAVHSPSQSYDYPDAEFVIDSTVIPVNYWKGRTAGLKLPECLGIVADLAEYPLGVVTSDMVFEDEPDYFDLVGLTAWEHLVEVVDAFAARLFFLRDGRIFGMDSSDVAGLGSAAPYAGAQEKTGLTRNKPFESLFTGVNVQVRPSGAPFWHNDALPTFASNYGEQTWSNSGPIELPANSELLIELEHGGGSGKLSGTTIDVVSSFEAWPNADRFGNPLDMLAPSEANVEVVSETVDGKTYKSGRKQHVSWIKFSNNVGSTAYFFDVVIKGVGIKDGGQVLRRSVADTEIQAVNGVRVMDLNNRLIQTDAMAQSVANKYLAACSTRDRASVSWLGYHANGDGIKDLLTGYDVGTVVDFGDQGGGTALANYGVYGERLIVGQEVEWMDTSGQNVMARLCFERLPILQVEINGAVSSDKASFVESMSFSHTVVAGDDQILLVAVAERSWGWVWNMNYGGVALTKLDYNRAGWATNGDLPQVEFWYLVNPTVGTANVVVNFDKPDWVHAAAMTLSHVDTANPFGARSKDKDVTDTISLDVACNKGDLVIDVCGSWFDGTPVPADGQTLVWHETTDNRWRGFGSSKPGSILGTVNMGWTVVADAAHGWAAMGVAVKARYGA